MEKAMDEWYKKAARKMQLKLNCERYLRKITDDFMTHDGQSYCFEHVTKRSMLRRQLRVCPKLEENLKARNITVEAFMKHMARPAIHTMVQHWLTTLPAYREDKEYPAGEICNQLLWSEMSGTYGYMIWQADSYVWKVSENIADEMITYYKLANRYFECKQIGDEEICKAWLKFKPVDMDQLPKVFEGPQHLETVQLPALIANAKSRGEVMLNIAEHIIAKSMDDTDATIPDVTYTSKRHKKLNVMMRPKPHHI